MYVIPTYKNIMIGVENSEEGQIVDYDQMIRIIYLQQLNAQIDIRNVVRKKRNYVGKIPK